MSRAKAMLQFIPCCLAAALAGCFHWIPAAPEIQRWVVVLGWLGLLQQRGRPLFWPAFSLAAVETCSNQFHGLPLENLMRGDLPWLGLAPMLAGWQSPRRPWYERLFWLGELLSAHAIVSFLAFHWAGGGHRIRPEIDQGWLKALVWPYYCGHYPRGAHAVGIFLNDNNLGLWCLMLFLLGLVQLRRPGICLGLAVLWSYSRTALVSTLICLIWLVWRWERRTLWLLLVLPLGLAAFPTWLDGQRLLHPLGPVAYPEERVYWGGRALHGLASGSLLGEGPDSAGLVDSQWCKTTVELGWAGLLAWLAFFASLARRKSMPVWLFAWLLGGGGNDLLYSPLLVGTGLTLAGLAGGQEFEANVPIGTDNSCGGVDGHGCSPTFL
ncbi:MAG: hypothetical protein U0931_06480 [Vulcanimicrobiota bacterium]